MDTGGKIAHQPSGKARQNEQREYLRHYDAECSPEIHSLHRLDQWNDQRDKDSRQQIYKDRVGRDSGDIATELAGHHSGCSSGRTNQAEHGAFDKYNLPLAFARNGMEKPVGKKSETGEEAALDQQKPPVPAVRLQVLRLYAAEGQEEHGKDQQRLEHSNSPA